jgi:2-methylcitrate dehydratase PrpD
VVRAPDGHREALVRTVRDLGGVIVAGLATETVGRVHAYLDATAGPGPSPVIGTARTVDPVSAALANGSAAQALDFDDIAPSCVSHLGAVMVPAVAALVHDVGPDRALAGLAVGLAVVDRLAEAFTHEAYDRGIQPTHAMGSIGATVALLHALDAPVAERSAALGLLATHVVGLRAHTGTRYKPVQAGMVSAAAVRSVLLANAGLTAGDDALDVMLRLAGVTDDQLVHLQRPGELCPVPVAAKAFPTCGANHTAIEATLGARAAAVAAGATPADLAAVASLHVTSPPRVMMALEFDRPSGPGAPDEARFSMPYAVAVAWLTGTVVPADFTPDAIARPDVGAVMDRVEVTLDDALTPPPTWSGFPAIMRATLASGDPIETRVDRPLGYPERPFTDAQWKAKFLLNTTPHLGRDAAESAYDTLATPSVLTALAPTLLPSA